MRSLSALNVEQSILGITPIGSPNADVSISCCNASSDNTISPMLILAFKEPAIPVLIIAETL